jgi:hypothetical protein
MIKLIERIKEDKIRKKQEFFNNWYLKYFKHLTKNIFVFII